METNTCQRSPLTQRRSGAESVADKNSKKLHQSENSVTNLSRKLANGSPAQTNNRYAFLRNSSEEPVKQLGITSAISFAGPCPEALERTKELIRVLRSHNAFESKKELNHRIEVLGKLNILYKEWVKDVSIARGMPEADAKQLGGKIQTFGSYRIGVHDKGADIDALCLAPRNIERFEYFSSFFELLKHQPEVTECRSVEEAFVPVIKMIFDGIQIDLLFARLALRNIPDNIDILDDKLLADLDTYSVRSLNGCRVTEQILTLVPNVANFRLTLRCIKLWAKKHGIYSNILGYFGGVTWAMLVARTCQLYPNATASTLVEKFFLIFSRWSWPSPVLLSRPSELDLNLPVWDPRINNADRYHLMPIITPAYPQQNSTFNVTHATKKVIIKEINRGMSTVHDIVLKNMSWDCLFMAPSFFHGYRHYIVLLVNSHTADDHKAWRGLVESKIRFLIASLERNYYLSLVHAHPKCYDLKKPSKNVPFCSMWFIGLEFKEAGKLNLDITEVVRDFNTLVTEHAIKINIFKETMSINVEYSKRKQLPRYLDCSFLKRERLATNNYNNTIIANRQNENEILEKCGSNNKRGRVSESSSDISSADENAMSTTIANSQQQKKQKVMPQ